jgi:hypothetical protein
MVTIPTHAPYVMGKLAMKKSIHEIKQKKAGPTTVTPGSSGVLRKKLRGEMTQPLGTAG